MAISASTISGISGAVSDIFKGFGAQAEGSLKQMGLDIQARGTEISAESTELTAESLRTKAKGDIAEAQNYDLAANLAQENAAYTAQSTRIQQFQEARKQTQTIGAQRAAEGAAGFGEGGSAFYLMRDSANQGALARGVIGLQGAITEAGYTEQAKSYTTMADTGRMTAASEQDIANKTDTIAGQQREIAQQQVQLGVQTKEAADEQATGDFVGGAFKAVASIASIFL